MVGLLGRDQRSVGSEREVDAGVGHQVGLELVQVHVQGSLETQRGGDGGDHLQTQSYNRNAKSNLIPYYSISSLSKSILSCFYPGLKRL